MRELTLIETGYLAGGLVLCLVLPLLMSFYAPQDSVLRRSCMKTVWTGQLVLTFAGLMVLASGLIAPYAAVLGLVSTIGCARVLVGKMRGGERAEVSSKQ